MDLWLVLWLTILAVGTIVLLFLLAIDVIEEIELVVIFACILFPPITVVFSVFFVLMEMYNTCSKNKAKIRKFLRLKDQGYLTHTMTLLFLLIGLICYVVGFTVIVYLIDKDDVDTIQIFALTSIIVFPPIIIVWFIVWVTISICDLIFEDNDNTKPRT